MAITVITLLSLLSHVITYVITTVITMKTMITVLSPVFRIGDNMITITLSGVQNSAPDMFLRLLSPALRLFPFHL